MDPVERHLTGPLEWVARSGNSQANPSHVEMSLDQLLSFRPSPSLSGYRAPIDRLFLTGAGTHPGGAITGQPGRNAAAVVLDRLGAARPAQPARRRPPVTLVSGPSGVPCGARPGPAATAR
jgi:beta-carotene ketolase (CrtO type)